MQSLERLKLSHRYRFENAVAYFHLCFNYESGRGIKSWKALNNFNETNFPEKLLGFNIIHINPFPLVDAF